MSDQPASQLSRDSQLCNKLKNFLWNKSVATRVKNISGTILLGGGVCYVPWLTSDALSPDYPVLRVWLILMGIFLLLAHITSTIVEKEPELRRPIITVGCLLFAGITAFVWVKRSNLVDSEWPVLSPTSIHLMSSHPQKEFANGMEQETEVTISNPNRFPLHLVTLGIEISNNIQSGSISIDIDESPEPEFALRKSEKVPEFGRLNDVPTKNPNSKNIIVLIYTVPPSGHRTLRIGCRNEVSASLSVIEYSRNFEIFHSKYMDNDFISWSFIPPSSIAFKYVTNMTPEYVTNFTFKMHDKKLRLSN